MLLLLSGKTHQVLTAIALQIEPHSIPLSLVQISAVTFAALTPQEIASYIASQEPYGKAGAYAIQGLGSTWISSITGSYSGIMGLPIFELSQLLDHAKVARI
jgi:septum formation protein